ncbi:MAG TPA: DMT family transporter [Candidatus Dojkabacteria bacterium]|nr:DMT family transporter [Candidatus Dojkabacteria bacterium]
MISEKNRNKKQKLANILKNPYILLVLANITWGLSPSIIKLGIESVDFWSFVTYRLLVVTVIVLVIFVFRRKLKGLFKVFTKPRYLLTMGLLIPWSAIFNFWGISLTSAIIASTVTALNPLIAAIMGMIILKEKINKGELAGTILAFIGVIGVLVVQSVSNGGGGGEAEMMLNSTDAVNQGSSLLLGNLAGIGLILAGFILWLFGNILFTTVPSEDQDNVSYGSFIFGLVNIFILALIFSKDNLFVFDFTNTNLIISILYMALFGSLIGAVFHNEGIKKVEVSEANFFTYLQPIVGIPAAVFILNENFNYYLLIPILVIIVGVWLNLKSQPKNSKPLADN